MKKLSVHLSLLCLLALLIPFAGCKKEETTEETPMASDTMMETTTTEPSMATSDTMGSDMMGTDMMTSEPMGTDMAPPPGQ